MIRIIIFIFLALFISCVPEKKPAEEKVTPREETKTDILIHGEKEVVTFVYHRFGDDRFPSTNIAVADFESHLKWLRANNYQVLSLADALAY